jgi:hypothetical protein
MILILEHIQNENSNPGVGNLLNKAAKFKIQKSWQAKNEAQKRFGGPKRNILLGQTTYVYKRQTR